MTTRPPVDAEGAVTGIGGALVGLGAILLVCVLAYGAWMSSQVSLERDDPCVEADWATLRANATLPRHAFVMCGRVEGKTPLRVVAWLRTSDEAVRRWVRDLRIDVGDAIDPTWTPRTQDPSWWHDRLATLRDMPTVEGTIAGRSDRVDVWAAWTPGPADTVDLTVEVISPQ